MELLEPIRELLPISPPFSIVRIEKEESLQEVHIYLSVSKEARPSSDYHLHSCYSRTWEHLRLFQYRTFIHCDLPIYRHKNNPKDLQKAVLSFARDYSRFTLLYEQEVLRLMGLHHCIETVAQQLAVLPQRIAHIYHAYTEESYLQHTITPCEKVGCDETNTHKGHDYITLFVDMDNHQILDIQDGKSSEAIAGFFQAHPYPEAVREFSMDMSAAFIAGVQTYFPHITPTFDKWHVLKLLYKHLADLGAKAQAFQAQLACVLDQLRDLFDQENHAQAQAQLAFVADFAQETMGENPLTKTIYRHFQGITQYAKTQLNNGLLEGINSKIQIIKRLARGFRYKEHFKKMILFVFGTIKPRIPCKIT
jgi:transposase